MTRNSRSLSEALPGRLYTEWAGTLVRPGDRCPRPRCGKCSPGDNTWWIALSPQRQGAREHQQQKKVFGNPRKMQIFWSHFKKNMRFYGP